MEVPEAAGSERSGRNFSTFVIVIVLTVELHMAWMLKETAL